MPTQFPGSRHMKVARLSALRNGLLYTSKDIPGIHSSYSLSWIQRHNAVGRKLKRSARSFPCLSINNEGRSKRVSLLQNFHNFSGGHPIFLKDTSDFFTRVKRPKYRPDHSRTSSADFRMNGVITPSPLMLWCRGQWHFYFTHASGNDIIF